MLMAISIGMPPALAETRALLIGVSDYDDAIGLDDLRGPANDVRLLRDVLGGRGVTDIAVLADGVEGGAVPTRAAILAAFDDMAARAGAGDLVYVHLSGHGTRQQDLNGDETDGLDEVFMPRDVGIMRRGMTEWPNSYVDKDIKADIDAIRAKGAFVWALFDCCHSATITRNLEMAAEGEKSRKVNLADYDIPDDMWQPATTRSTAAGMAAQPQTMFGAVGTVGTEDGLPPMVAFFAAQKIEETPELPLPRDAEDRVQLGLFTFTLLTQLRTHPGATYTELGQAIHHQRSVGELGQRIVIGQTANLLLAMFAASDVGEHRDIFVGIALFVANGRNRQPLGVYRAVLAAVPDFI